MSRLIIKSRQFLNGEFLTIADHVVRVPVPSRFEQARSIAAQKCKGCYDFVKPEKKETQCACQWCGLFGIIVLVALIYVIFIIPLRFCSSSDYRREQVLKSSSDDEFDFARPEFLGLHCPTSYTIGYGNKIHIGLWYIPPRGGPCAEEIKNCCKKGPVFIYFHNLPGHRGKFIDIPRFLAEKINAHVFTFDYQGSGDSSDNLPSRETLLQDSVAILDTVLDVVPLERIYFWGHSFGALVAVDLAANISSPFGGLILEAPVTDTARQIELGKGLNELRIPLFKSCAIESVKHDNTLNYNSTSSLERISLEVPVQILHSRDDEEVPFELAQGLYEDWFRFRAERLGAYVSMLAFEESFGFGHNNIYKYDRLSDLVRQFLFRVPLAK